MPIRKFEEALTAASSRVIPTGAWLNGPGVKAPGALPGGSEASHIPITGCALLSEAAPDSSSAVTITENGSGSDAQCDVYPDRELKIACELNSNDPHTLMSSAAFYGYKGETKHALKQAMTSMS